MIRIPYLLKKLYALIDLRSRSQKSFLMTLCLSLFSVVCICQKQRQVLVDAHLGPGMYINCPGTLLSKQVKFSFGTKLQIRDQVSSRFFLAYGVGLENINGSFACESAITFKERSSSLLFLSLPVGIDYMLNEKLFISIEPSPSFVLRNRIRFIESPDEVIDDGSLDKFFMPIRVSMGISLTNRFDGIMTGLFSIGDPNAWQLCAGIRFYLLKGYRTGLQRKMD